MIFGPTVDVPDSVEAAEWVVSTAPDPPWTVSGMLVPPVFEAYLRVHAPAPMDEGWWDAYAAVFSAVVAVGVRHTTHPERGWFGVWEGHGWQSASSRIATWGPLDDAQRTELERRRAELRAEESRRSAAIDTGLAMVPRFDRPCRCHYLLSGPLAAVTEIREPGFHESWQRPDLFWPDDRRWFAATDVDIWSLYIGGEADFVESIAELSPTPTERVDADIVLPAED